MPEPISVLIPARNAASTIGLTLRSTLADLTRHDEVLVLVDGADDETRVRAEAVRDERLRVLARDESRGVARTLNELLAEAGSRVIARIDADDVWLPGRRRRQLRLLAAGHDLVFGGRFTFRTKPLRITLTRGGGLDADALELVLPFINPVMHPSAMMRADTVRAAGGWRPGAAEDWDLWVRTAVSGARLLRDPVPVIAYRVHAAQTSGAAGYHVAVDTDPDLLAERRRLLAAIADRVGADAADPVGVVDAASRPLPEQQRRRVHNLLAAARGGVEPAGQPPLTT